MKITKRQLRRIIKEEKKKLVEAIDHGRIEPYVRQMEQALNDLSDEGAANADLIDILQELIDDVKNGVIGIPDAHRGL